MLWRRRDSQNTVTMMTVMMVRSNLPEICSLQSSIFYLRSSSSDTLYRDNQCQELRYSPIVWVFITSNRLLGTAILRHSITSLSRRIEQILTSPRNVGWWCHRNRYWRSWRHHWCQILQLASSDDGTSDVSEYPVHNFPGVYWLAAESLS